MYAKYSITTTSRRAEGLPAGSVFEKCEIYIRSVTDHYADSLVLLVNRLSVLESYRFCSGCLLFYSK